MASTLRKPAISVSTSTPFMSMSISTSASSASCAEVLSSPYTISVRATNTAVQIIYSAALSVMAASSFALPSRLQP